MFFSNDEHVNTKPDMCTVSLPGEVRLFPFTDGNMRVKALILTSSKFK
jgi:hypothetical protein